MSGHTPGPWLTDVDVSGWSVGTEDKFIAFTNGEHSDEDISPNEEAANARLMAAAPDLLEALKRVCSHGYRSSPDWDNARAAIAKAEGA
jgi:hypothetical protein